MLEHITKTPGSFAIEEGFICAESFTCTFTAPELLVKRKYKFQINLTKVTEHHIPRTKILSKQNTFAKNVQLPARGTCKSHHCTFRREQRVQTNQQVRSKHGRPRRQAEAFRQESYNQTRRRYAGQHPCPSGEAGSTPAPRERPAGCMAGPAGSGFDSDTAVPPRAVRTNCFQSRLSGTAASSTTGSPKGPGRPAPCLRHPKEREGESKEAPCHPQDSGSNHVHTRQRRSRCTRIGVGLVRLTCSPT